MASGGCGSVGEDAELRGFLEDRCSEFSRAFYVHTFIARYCSRDSFCWTWSCNGVVLVGPSFDLIFSRDA